MQETVKQYTYEEIKAGQQESFQIEVTEEMIDQFGRITGDCNPLHRSGEYARSKGYRDRVSYGMLTASFLSTLAGVWLPGERSLIHQVEAEFPNPVYAGDVLTVTGSVKEKEDTFGLLYLKVEIRNQKGQKVLRGKMRVQVCR